MKTGITINDQPVLVPSSWNEITFGQYLELSKAETDAQTMAALTGVDIKLCEQVSPEMMAVILEPSSKLGDVVYLDMPTIENKEVPRNLGSMEFARKVNCDALKCSDEERVGKMVAIYCANGIEDEDIDTMYASVLNESFANVVSAGKIISEQLVELRKGEEVIKAPEYTSEEWSAGINEFKKYGVFGLVRGIALRHHCSMQDVFGWSYNSVLLELQYSADENAYQRKLNSILSRK